MMVDSVPAERGIAYNYPMERPKTSQGRPKTGHGRRRSDAEEPVIRPTEVPPAEDLPPRPTTSRSNRPRTSHGRRPPDQQQLMQQHQQRYIQQEQQQYEQQQQQQQQQHYQQQHYQQQQQHPYTQDDYPFERPKTSHGRRRSSLQLHDSSISPRQYMTPDREQPSPYRPGSAMRPGTSSLSHYSVLPPIGAKADPTPPPPPSPPRLGERSVTMLNLNADLQIMKLEDDGEEEEEGEEEGGEMQKHGGVFKATGEAEMVGDVSAMQQGEMGTTWQHQKQHQGETNILTHNPPPTTPDKIQLQREGSFLSGGKISEESPPPFRPLTRENTLSEEPSAGDSNSGTILLAVKLPDGQRVSRRFRGDETLGMVLHFAEVTSRLDFAGYDLVCDAPRTVFRDLGVTVAESGLATRTVLHIRFPDP